MTDKHWLNIRKSHTCIDVGCAVRAKKGGLLSKSDRPDQSCIDGACAVLLRHNADRDAWREEQRGIPAPGQLDLFKRRNALVGNLVKDLLDVVDVALSELEALTSVQQPNTQDDSLQLGEPRSCCSDLARPTVGEAPHQEQALPSPAAGGGAGRGRERTPAPSRVTGRGLRAGRVLAGLRGRPSTTRGTYFAVQPNLDHAARLVERRRVEGGDAA